MANSASTNEVPHPDSRDYGNIDERRKCFRFSHGIKTAKGIRYIYLCL
jgi:hypothetical protein